MQSSTRYGREPNPVKQPVDGLLKIRIPVGTKFLAFADDLAIVGIAKDTIHLNRILETVASEAVSGSKPLVYT